MIKDKKKISSEHDEENGCDLDGEENETYENNDNEVDSDCNGDPNGNDDDGDDDKGKGETTEDNPYQRMVRSLTNRPSNKRKVKLMETQLVQFTFGESDSDDDEDYVVGEEEMKKVMSEDDDSDDNDHSEDARSDNSSDEGGKPVYSLGDMLRSYESGSTKFTSHQDSSDEELDSDNSEKSDDEQGNQQGNVSDAGQDDMLESEQKYFQGMVEDLEVDHNERESTMRYHSRHKKPVSICGICLESEENDGDEIVECDNCGIVVHEGCYGDYNLDDDSKSGSDDLMEPWFCEPCKAEVSDLVCELCPTKGGIFKQTDTGKWAHLICALYTPYVGFRDVIKLQVVVLEDIKNHMWGSKECLFCTEENFSKTGVCISCDAGLCRTAFHVTCGQKHGFLSDIPDRGERHDEVDFLFAHCKLHTTKNVLKKRKNSWLAYQARVSKFQHSNDPEEKERITSALYHSRNEYKEFRSNLIPARQLPQEFPRFLSSCPEACMMLARKAELLDMVREAGFNVNAAIISGRISKHEANLSEDFVNYFFKREIQLKEIKQALKFADPNIIKLQNEQKILAKKVELYFAKLEKTQRRKNYLVNCCQKYHDVLSKLAGKNLKLPHVLKDNCREEMKEKIEKSAELLNSIINRCSTCKSTEHQHLLAQCGTCSKYYHMNCVVPPLTRLPKKSDKFVWQCTSCDPSDKSESDSESVQEGSGMVRRKRQTKEPEKYNPEPVKEKKGKDSDIIQEEKDDIDSLEVKKGRSDGERCKVKKEKSADKRKANKDMSEIAAKKKKKRKYLQIKKGKKEVYSAVQKILQKRKDLKAKRLKEIKENVGNKRKISSEDSLSIKKKKIMKKDCFEFESSNEDSLSIKKKKTMKKDCFEFESSSEDCPRIKRKKIFKKDSFEFESDTPDIAEDEKKVKEEKAAKGESCKVIVKVNEHEKEIKEENIMKKKGRARKTKVTLTDCFVCKKFLDEKLLVKCDECGRCYHFLTCINPPYPRNPKVNKYWAWFCEECDNSDEQTILEEKRASNKQALLSIKSSFKKKSATEEENSANDTDKQSKEDKSFSKKPDREENKVMSDDRLVECKTTVKENERFEEERKEKTQLEFSCKNISKHSDSDTAIPKQEDFDYSKNISESHEDDEKHTCELAEDATNFNLTDKQETRKPSVSECTKVLSEQPLVENGKSCHVTSANLQANIDVKTADVEKNIIKSLPADTEGGSSNKSFGDIVNEGKENLSVAKTTSKELTVDEAEGNKKLGECRVKETRDDVSTAGLEETNKISLNGGMGDKNKQFHNHENHGFNQLSGNDKSEADKQVSYGVSESNKDLPSSDLKDNQTHLNTDGKKVPTIPPSPMEDKKQSNIRARIDDSRESRVAQVDENRNASTSRKVDEQKETSNISFGDDQKGGKRYFDGKKEVDKRHQFDGQIEGSSRYRGDEQKVGNKKSHFDERRGSHRHHRFPEQKDKKRFYSYDRNEGYRRFHHGEYNETNNRHRFDGYNERNNRYPDDERHVGTSRYYGNDKKEFDQRPPFYHKPSGAPVWSSGNRRNRDKPSYDNDRGRKFNS